MPETFESAGEGRLILQTAGIDVSKDFQNEMIAIQWRIHDFSYGGASSKRGTSLHVYYLDNFKEQVHKNEYWNEKEGPQE